MNLHLLKGPLHKDTSTLLYIFNLCFFFFCFVVPNTFNVRSMVVVYFVINRVLYCSVVWCDFIYLFKLTKLNP